MGTLSAKQELHLSLCQAQLSQAQLGEDWPEAIGLGRGKGAAERTCKRDAATVLLLPSPVRGVAGRGPYGHSAVGAGHCSAHPAPALCQTPCDVWPPQSGGSSVCLSMALAQQQPGLPPLLCCCWGAQAAQVLRCCWTWQWGWQWAEDPAAAAAGRQAPAGDAAGIPQCLWLWGPLQLRLYPCLWAQQWWLLLRKHLLQLPAAQQAAAIT